MRARSRIVAINKDADAPLLKLADIGVVGSTCSRRRRRHGGGPDTARLLSAACSSWSSSSRSWCSRGARASATGSSPPGATSRAPTILAGASRRLARPGPRAAQAVPAGPSRARCTRRRDLLGLPRAAPHDRRGGDRDSSTGRGRSRRCTRVVVPVPAGRLRDPRRHRRGRDRVLHPQGPRWTGSRGSHMGGGRPSSCFELFFLTPPASVERVFSPPRRRRPPSRAPGREPPVQPCSAPAGRPRCSERVLGLAYLPPPGFLTYLPKEPSTCRSLPGEEPAPRLPDAPLLRPSTRPRRSCDSARRIVTDLTKKEILETSPVGRCQAVVLPGRPASPVAEVVRPWRCATRNRRQAPGLISRPRTAARPWSSCTRSSPPPWPTRSSGTA